MPKIPDCNRCQYFLHSSYLICAVNPHGPAGSACKDFSTISREADSTIRRPLGGGYYAGDWVPQPSAASEEDGLDGRHCDWKDAPRS